MPATFTDGKGRTWLLGYNVGVLSRMKAADPEFYDAICNISPDHVAMKVAIEFAHDHVRAARLAFAVIAVQAASQGVSEEDFLSSIGASEIMPLRRALENMYGDSKPPAPLHARLAAQFTAPN